MGLLNSLLGADTESTTQGTEPEPQQYAVVLNAGPDETAKAGNAFNYALELDDGGYEVQVFLDGQAAKWPAEYAENEDGPFSHDWEKLQERGLMAGACGFCANAFDATEACENAGIDLLSESDEHAPAIEQLAKQEYEILTVG